MTPADITPARAGLSWSAAFGGAAVATAVTVMLLALGSGIGLGAVSTDAATNPSATTFTVLAAIWLIVVQWIASFFGGYLAGRLRPGWSGVDPAETTFRDTATGFVAWAVSTLLIVGLVTSGATSVLGGAGRALSGVAASAAASGASSASSANAPSGYLLDTLFRPTAPNPQENSTEAKAEAGRILATAATGNVSAADHDYLVQMVASRTGLSADDAGKRVDTVIGDEKQAVAKAKQAAEAARKAAAGFATYTFFSMLVGAFIACVAAAIGGRQRDTY